MPRAFAIVLLLAAAVRAETPATQPVASATTRPSPIRVETVVRQNPNLRLHIARIDLTDPRLEVVVSAGGPDPDGAGPWETTLMTPSSIAARDKLDLAVNTVFFARQTDKPDEKFYAANAPARSVQPVVSNGKVLSPVGQGVSLVFGPQNRATIETLRVIAPTVRQVASGDKPLLIRGRSVAEASTVTHPRTAAGLSADRKTLVLLVIDGRRPDWSVGVTLTQLAAEMAALGCTDALNLDGGGSSAMVRRDGDTYPLVNLPSDGSTLPLPLSFERPVPYVLGFRLR